MNERNEFAQETEKKKSLGHQECSNNFQCLLWGRMWWGKFIEIMRVFNRTSFFFLKKCTLQDVLVPKTGRERPVTQISMANDYLKQIFLFVYLGSLHLRQGSRGQHWTWGRQDLCSSGEGNFQTGDLVGSKCRIQAYQVSHKDFLIQRRDFDVVITRWL